MGLFLSQAVISQGTLEGNINADMLKKIQESFKGSATDIALMNAITHNDIKKLAQTRSSDSDVNHLFSNKIEIVGITNQKSSGRCWLYTGLNTIRPMVREKYNLNDIPSVCYWEHRVSFQCYAF